MNLYRFSQNICSRSCENTAIFSLTFKTYLCRIIILCILDLYMSLFLLTRKLTGFLSLWEHFDWYKFNKACVSFFFFLFFFFANVEQYLSDVLGACSKLFLKHWVLGILEEWVILVASMSEIFYGYNERSSQRQFFRKYKIDGLLIQYTFE
jgi:hypothetical protein